MRTLAFVLAFAVASTANAQAVPLEHEGGHAPAYGADPLTLAVTETNELRAALGLERTARAALLASLESARAELQSAAERVRDAEGSGFWPGLGYGLGAGLIAGAGIVLAAFLAR